MSKKSIFKGSFLALYAQILIIDNGRNQSCPVFISGLESFSITPNGVSVATAIDKKILVSVFKDTMPEIDHRVSITTEIQINHNELLIGNIVAADMTILPIPNGKYILTIGTNGIRNEATEIWIYINVPEDD